MSKNEIKDDKIALRGNWETPDLPVDSDNWSIAADVTMNGGRPVGATFSGNVEGIGVGGSVQTGDAMVFVGGDRSKLTLQYNRERITGSVAYVVGNEQAKITGTFDSKGNLTGNGELRFKDTVINFSPNNIGASYDFSDGWRGTLTRDFGGGVGVNFSGNGSFGSGTRFNLSLGATGNGGSWGVNAKFQLEVLTSM